MDDPSARIGRWWLVAVAFGAVCGRTHRKLCPVPPPLLRYHPPRLRTGPVPPGCTRRPSTTDGRGRVVALTDAGRLLIDEAFAEHMRNERRLVDQLSPDDAARLEAILTTWLACFERA